MIKMENVSKQYPTMDRPAVSELSIEVKEGEICVFVGPSGCGKTTTLKMINRIIEPTSGNIFINGKNVLDQDPDKLRQHIGYVIQRIGLFPHINVYENIATVPRLLGWDEDIIAKRVDELLTLVGLDPDENRKKFPKELSGGQMQRVGVARAMAANPPVMLMDEPFGAVDPIIRTQLQNEFLRLQNKVKKTICFVTHDIDEAIKMGDKIAIMYKGQLVQYDTPENILFAPKNEFVEQFVGSDRSLKVLNLLKVHTVLKKPKSVTPDTQLNVVRKMLEQSTGDRIIVKNNDGYPRGLITKKDIKNADSARGWNMFIKPIPVTLPEQASLRDALSEMLHYNVSAIPINDKDGRLKGIVYLSDIRSYIGEAYQEYEQEENGVK
ncbi:MAG: betaine/proline/choline family ABC transporter ATP-binding protein [Mahellales bacterium]|jgi:osmoprotectant transport system ATP-binding protein